MTHVRDRNQPLWACHPEPGHPLSWRTSAVALKGAGVHSRAKVSNSLGNSINLWCRATRDSGPAFGGLFPQSLPVARCPLRTQTALSMALSPLSARSTGTL